MVKLQRAWSLPALMIDGPDHQNLLPVMTSGLAEQAEDLPHCLHKFPCDDLTAFFEFIPRATNAQYLALYSKIV